MSAATIVFRVDAGADVGLGHAKRCLVLAQELHERGMLCHFVMRSALGDELADMLSPHQLHRLPSGQAGLTQEKDAQATSACIHRARIEPSWVVIDNYALDAAWERHIRQGGPRIAVIDDFRTRPHCADLIISDVATRFDPALNALGCPAQALTGPQYSLIDKAFTADRAPGLPKVAARILISYGGSDETHETEKALQAIRTLKQDLGLTGRIGPVDVVAALGRSRFEALRHLAGGIAGVSILPMQPSLAPLMRRCDIFVTSGGRSLIEALVMRRPTIVTITADNQQLSVAALAAQGLTRALGFHDSVSVADIASNLTAVLDDLAGRRADLERAPFDPHGAERIADVMLSPQFPRLNSQARSQSRRADT